MALPARVTDLLPYELLESIAETGSIGRCGRRHGVSQAENGRAPEDLLAAEIGRDRLLVLVATDHPWADRRGISVDELAPAPLITRERGSGTRAAVEEHLARLGHPLGGGEPALELTSSTAIKNAVTGRLGPAVLSSLAVTDELAGGRLRAVPVRGARLDRTLHAVWAPGRHLGDPARELLREIGTRAPP
ncbi:MAG TPA: LysR substrate-binding domain-containing protein [Pseudonocardia sp.]